MGGHTETENANSSLNLSVAQNADRRRWGSTGASLGATDIVRIRRYWSQSSRPYLAPASIRYIDPLTNVDKTISPIWSVENDRSDSQQLARTRYRYAIAALNAKLLDNRLMLLGAVRADSFFNHVRQQQSAGDYDAATWNGTTYIFKPDAPGDWADLTFVPKAANGTPTGPAIAADTRPRDGNGNPQAQYARDRFKDDFNAPAIDKREITRSVGAVFHLTRWLSPYANYAETFNPPGAIQRIDSSFLPPTVAKGIDLGLRFSLLEGRVTFSVARYTNEEENNGFDPGVQGNINGILAANAVGDLTPSGRNIRGLGNVPAVMRDLRDRSAEGWEFETVANVTKQWRLLANIGLAKVYEENAYRDAKAYFAANDAMLRQIMIDTGALIDATGAATVNNAIPINDRSPDVNGAVNSWNNLAALRRNLVDRRRLLQDQPSINVFTDYTLGATPPQGPAPRWRRAIPRQADHRQPRRRHRHQSREPACRDRRSRGRCLHGRLLARVLLHRGPHRRLHGPPRAAPRAALRSAREQRPQRSGPALLRQHRAAAKERRPHVTRPRDRAECLRLQAARELQPHDDAAILSAGFLLLPPPSEPRAPRIH